jgi:purple acid phosphatase-like protein
MTRSLRFGVVLLFIVAAASGATPALAIPVSSPSSDGGPEVGNADHMDVSPPLRSLRPAPRAGSDHGRDRGALEFRSAVGAQPAVSPGPPAGTGAPVGSAPTVGANFDGIGQGLGTYAVCCAPPDPNGAVGPNHYVQAVNLDFAVFSKAGVLLFGPAPLNTMWSGFGGGCQTNNDGDPIVLYDTSADRWLISQISVATTPYLECVAVSQTSDPTGAYYRYSFNYGNVDFPDYPKFGVWTDGYYVTFNVFANGVTFTGAKVCSYDRAKMLTGAAATQQCFKTGAAYGGLLPATLDGTTLPPAGSPNFLVALDTSTTLASWKFHVDWTTPASTTFTGPSSLAVTGYSTPCAGAPRLACVPQLGTTTKLESLGDRLMHRLAYRNFGDHEALVVNHTIVAGSSAGVRWYELRVVSGNLTVWQQGTYAPDAKYRWMGSIAMDRSGDIGLGYSASSSSIRPQIHFTGRLSGDALGTMTQGQNVLVSGAGSQTGLSRWGDYSALTVDPTDDCTFWYTNEYLKTSGSFNWSTRIGSFKLPGCGAAPPSANLLANPGFESGATGWTLPAQASIDGTVARSGTSSLKLVATGPSQLTWQWLNATPGQSYTISGWERSTTSGGYLSMYSYDGSWTPLDVDGKNLIFSASGTFTQLSGTYVPPAGAVYVIVGLQSDKSGTFWFDDLSLSSAPPPPLHVTGVQPTNVGATSAVITWQTNNPANSKVEYGTTTAYTGGVVTDPAAVTNHSVTLSGLTPNTTYHFKVTSVDVYNQSDSSQDATFATTPTSANLLANPGFESGATGWTLPAQASIDGTVARSGTSSLKLVATGPSQLTWQWLNATPGQSYTISGWERSTTSGGYLSMYSYDGSWTPLDVDGKNLIFSASGTFTQLSGTYVPPAGAVYVIVGLQSDKSGTFWFDDLSLTTP